MKLCNKPRTEHRQTVGRKQKRRYKLDHTVFYIVVDETENAHKDEKHRQDIQQHGGNMQGQRAEPDQERENKHDRSQQDFQNELHIFINSFAYILQFNRSGGKDAAERDSIGAAALLFDACKLYQYPIRHVPKLLLILDDLLQIRIIDAPGFIHPPRDLIDVVAGIAKK